ncbi:MAG: pirin family protein [Cocleimonas sp.]|nr:pirin family protein [Cocleimonas sp.]
MKRTIKKIITGEKTSDGKGVQLTRLIGSSALDMLDPFLLMDAFGSDKPQDYIGGFPPHPHRGFETVTYLFAGKMRHKDSVGNSGIIETGGVQWMRAGKGIIHSEMPEQEEGVLFGVQLWVNLPTTHKMSEPHYQEVNKTGIPKEIRGGDCFLKVIAGKTKNGTQGAMSHDLIDPLYWDIHFSQHATFSDKIPAGHNAFIYVIEGEITVYGESVTKNQLAVLSDGHHIEIKSASSARFLLIAGKPLNEPVSRSGPFVMNTDEEIQQAFADYESGKLAKPFQA